MVSSPNTQKHNSLHDKARLTQREAQGGLACDEPKSTLGFSHAPEANHSCSFMAMCCGQSNAYRVFCREAARVVARSRNALRSHLQRQQDAQSSPLPALWEPLPQSDNVAAASCSPRAFSCSPKAICCSPDCSPSRACDPGRPGSATRSHRTSLPLRIWCALVKPTWQASAQYRQSEMCRSAE